MSDVGPSVKMNPVAIFSTVAPGARILDGPAGTTAAGVVVGGCPCAGGVAAVGLGGAWTAPSAMAAAITPPAVISITRRIRKLLGRQSSRACSRGCGLRAPGTRNQDLSV